MAYPPTQFWIIYPPRSGSDCRHARKCLRVAALRRILTENSPLGDPKSSGHRSLVTEGLMRGPPNPVWRRFLAVVLLLGAVVASTPGGTPVPPYPAVLTHGPVMPRSFVSVGLNARRVIPAALDSDPYPDLLVINQGGGGRSTPPTFG